MMITVITATRDRPAQLAMCIEQVRRQSVAGFVAQHLVVADGPDPAAQRLCAHYRELSPPDTRGPGYLELPEPVGRWGAGCKDLGIARASGDYVCF